MNDTFDSASKINHLSSKMSPVLFIHGQEDNIIPVLYGLNLFKMVSGNKEFKIIKNHGHNDLPDLTKILSDFFEKYAICKEEQFKKVAV